MKKKRVIVWFRNDLRLHDNEALYDAIHAADEVIPVYVFDERVFSGRSSFGFRKTGAPRARFILESVENLRSSLQDLGGDLVIRVGRPEIEIFKLAKNLKTSWVFCNRERTDEEVRVQDSLEKNLWSIGQEVRFSRGKMLYYTSDLPFPVTHTPDAFTQFKKEVERLVPVRDIIPSPEVLNPVTADLDPGELPVMQDFGYSPEDISTAGQRTLIGGESKALKNTKAYFDRMTTEDLSQDDLYLANMADVSMFSAYLAQGCLSPKYLYAVSVVYEFRHPSNPIPKNIFQSLVLRDYYRLMAKKYGNAIFKKGGMRGVVRPELSDDMSLFRIWAEARTGIPLVDAGMRQLNQTGTLAGKLRPALASFLINDLQINWQMGAEYFESLLVDYDPCSNWCNWNYMAGLATDSRDVRHVPISFYSKKIDPNGSYVRQWIPELSGLSDEYIHDPAKLSKGEALEFGLTLGKDYPSPCLSLT